MKEKIKNGGTDCKWPSDGGAVHPFGVPGGEHGPFSGPSLHPVRWLRGENTVSQVQEEQSDPAAYPLAVSAFQKGDLYYAYTQQPVSAIYTLLRPTLEEALGSMSEKKAMDREDYHRVLLEEQGFLLEYDGLVPLTAMRSWSGASPGEMR